MTTATHITATDIFDSATDLAAEVVIKIWEREGKTTCTEREFAAAVARVAKEIFENHCRKIEADEPGKGEYLRRRLLVEMEAAA
ncbi:hypothetical protein [Actinopolymorpha pittospori]|uniref:Uncharacterized protein n=1 Tax=Actinopolymorpha pittospori TaxID=648752 RepID=A0A927MTY7_9ACTN|nr:hypothetical protein [Actinopolymorpha pittospori]MBE1606262.1 hypothetical protein [Actinopolymorpha pittospori]